MVNDREPKWGFVAPLLNSIKNEINLVERNKKLYSVLTNPQADKLTSDDKTICIALRKDFSFDENLINPAPNKLTKEESEETENLVVKEKKHLRLMQLCELFKNRVLIKRVIKFILVIFLLGFIFYMSKFGFILIKGFLN